MGGRGPWKPWNLGKHLVPLALLLPRPLHAPHAQWTDGPARCWTGLCPHVERKPWATACTLALRESPLHSLHGGARGQATWGLGVRFHRNEASTAPHPPGESQEVPSLRASKTPTPISNRGARRAPGQDTTACDYVCLCVCLSWWTARPPSRVLSVCWTLTPCPAPSSAQGPADTGMRGA